MFKRHLRGSTTHGVFTFWQKNMSPFKTSKVPIILHPTIAPSYVCLHFHRMFWFLFWWLIEGNIIAHDKKSRRPVSVETQQCRLEFSGCSERDFQNNLTFHQTTNVCKIRLFWNSRYLENHYFHIEASFNFNVLNISLFQVKRMNKQCILRQLDISGWG